MGKHRKHLVQSLATKMKDSDPHPIMRKLTLREAMGLVKVLMPVSRSLGM